MVEVFKTNVKKRGEEKMLLLILAEYFPNHKINFDLDDCDKILRVEGNSLNPLLTQSQQTIMNVLYYTDIATTGDIEKSQRNCKHIFIFANTKCHH